MTIIGADITDTAPALYFCDETRIVPRIKDKSYIPVLLEICQEEAVDCLIPTIDTDLLLLAENKAVQGQKLHSRLFPLSWIEIPSAGQFG